MISRPLVQNQHTVQQKAYAGANIILAHTWNL